MSSYQINAIATRALLDSNFKDAILNGQRRQMLLEFDLSEELVNAIMRIEGDDIHQFIYQLNNLMKPKNQPNIGNMVKKSYQKPTLKLIELTGPMDPKVSEAVQRLQRMAQEAKARHDMSRFLALERMVALLTGQT